MLGRYRPLFPRAVRYLASVAGVAAITWLLSLLLPRYHVANFSMIYLLLVLALAVYAGSGPAIVASVLSFLAFDWFFVPPVGRFTVDDPSEWLALFLFLVVAVITGQLAAGLRRRAEEARRRAAENSTLYELSMAILGDARLDHVLQVIVDRMLATFELRRAEVLLAAAGGTLIVAAEAGAALDPAERNAETLSAGWALSSLAPTAKFATAGGGTLTRPLTPAAGVLRRAREPLLGAYLPIVLGGQALGVVAAAPFAGARPLGSEQGRLLEAFVAQTALAIGRSMLAQEEEKARAAAESERFKSTFLASVSHDLRTPLTSIKAAAEGLRQDAERREDLEHRGLCVSIGQEADRLDRLVGNLLEISRIDAGALPLRRTLEDLSELIGSVVARVTPLLGHRRLTLQIPDDLPLVSVDAVQLDRVLTNLLENAAKFSPDGSEITVEVAAAQHEIVLRVRNDGRPLDAGERERIFLRFVRRREGANGARGTGLGLAIARGIVEAHGGQIVAAPDPTGVTIEVTLPRDSRPVAAPAEAHA